MASSSSEKELEEQLKEFGMKLIIPPSSVDELLNVLDKNEQVLIRVGQMPSTTMQDALLFPMKGLIASEILRHPDVDVQVLVTSCLIEITRITAPNPPYDDEKMKEIFRLTVLAFEHLAHPSSRNHSKAVSILDVVASTKSFLMMLDLGLNDLVIDMCKQFLKSLRSEHPDFVSSSMETIMTIIIDESEDISFDLLSPLLDSLRKENQDLSSLSKKLGEKVFANCASKLKPYLLEVVKTRGLFLDDYDEIVACICQNRLETFENSSQEQLYDETKVGRGTDSGHWQQVQPATGDVCPRDVEELMAQENPTLNNSLEKLELSQSEHAKGTEAQGNPECRNLKSMEALKSQSETESARKKRGRKPNSLINPEEGYDPSLVFSGKKGSKSELHKKSHKKDKVFGKEAMPSTGEKIANNQELPLGDNEDLGASMSPNNPNPCNIQRKRGRPRKSEKMMNQEADRNLQSSRKLVLNSEVKEEAQECADVNLEKEFRDRSELIAKPSNRSVRKGHVLKTEQETAQVPQHVGSEHSTKISADLKEKLMQKSLAKNSKRSTSLTTSDEGHTEAHVPLNKKIFFKATESSKTDVKRKRPVADKGKASEACDLDERLVGKGIKVWWPMDKTFYEGVVESFDPVKKRHKVLYTDGEFEILNLYKQRWELIADDASPSGEKKADIQIANSSSPREQKKRGRKPKSAKLEKADASLGRNEVSNANKVDAPNSDGKNQVDSKLGISESKAERSMDDEKLKDNGVKSIGKLKIKFTNPKQAVSELGSPKL